MIVKPVKKSIVIAWAKKHGWEHIERRYIRFSPIKYIDHPAHYELDEDCNSVWVEATQEIIEGEFEDVYKKNNFILCSAASNVPLFDPLT